MIGADGLDDGIEMICEVSLGDDLIVLMPNAK